MLEEPVDYYSEQVYFLEFHLKGVKDLLLEEREGKLKVTQAILYSEVKVQERVLRKALWMVHQGLVEIVMVLRMEIVVMEEAKEHR